VGTLYTGVMGMRSIRIKNLGQRVNLCGFHEHWVLLPGLTLQRSRRLPTRTLGQGKLARIAKLHVPTGLFGESGVY
jgi:hypothetical protein